MGVEAVRIAAVSWQIQTVTNEDEFIDRIDRVVATAAHDGAELVVLPESIDLELCSLDPKVQGRDIPPFLADGFERRLDSIVQIARRHATTLVAGTHLRKTDRGYVNSAVSVTQAEVALQDKNVLTQWELAEWGLVPGSGLRPTASLGVAVCYDSEFPGSVRALAEHGCAVVAVPAYTEHMRGFNRVRWACHARTVECQVCLVHASLVGGLGREPVVSTRGSSAVLLPSVTPFPESGVVAQTPMDQPGMAIGDVDLTQIAPARQSDDVRNWEDRDKGDWTVLT